MFQVGMSRIQALAGRAVETLEDLLGAKQYPSVRLGAARTVAEIGMHQYDANTIIRELDKAEAAQRQRRSGRSTSRPATETDQPGTWPKLAIGGCVRFHANLVAPPRWS
jgi:hypothetical protein